MAQQNDAITSSERAMRSPMNFKLTLIAAIVSSFTLSCSRDEQVKAKEGAPLSRSKGALQAKSPDRLPAGKLLEGEELAFGFRIPKGMKLSLTRKLARASGDVNFEDLSDYVKDRLVARHAEMFGARLVFPQAKIRGGDGGIYEVTLINGGREQILLIQDIGRPPAPVGLSEEERWKRAGLTPKGQLVDPKGMQ